MTRTLHEAIAEAEGLVLKQMRPDGPGGVQEKMLALLAEARAANVRDVAEAAKKVSDAKSRKPKSARESITD